jgi:hypothetical protein
MANLSDLEKFLREEPSIIDYKQVKTKVPIGYNKNTHKVIYKSAKALKIKLNLNDVENMDFFYELDDCFAVMIGNTFYKVSGDVFMYDYLNQSIDFEKNLEPKLEIGELYIILNDC